VIAMLREFTVEQHRRSSVSYRETIRVQRPKARQICPTDRGKGQYGHVVYRVEPGESGTGFEYRQQDRWR